MPYRKSCWFFDRCSAFFMAPISRQGFISFSGSLPAVINVLFERLPAASLICLIDLRSSRSCKFLTTALRAAITRTLLVVRFSSLWSFRDSWLYSWFCYFRLLSRAPAQKSRGRGLLGSVGLGCFMSTFEVVPSQFRLCPGQIIRPIPLIDDVLLVTQCVIVYGTLIYNLCCQVLRRQSLTEMSMMGFQHL